MVQSNLFTRLVCSLANSFFYFFNDRFYVHLATVGRKNSLFIRKDTSSITRFREGQP